MRLFLRLYNDINKQNINSKLSYATLIGILMLFAWLIISSLYFHLYFSKDISFVDSYSFDIKNQKSIVIGSGKEDGKNTYLTNKLAVENHLLLKFDLKDKKYIGTLELLTDKRKAIVNNVLLQNLSETENSIQEKLGLSSKNQENIKRIKKIKNGDFIRIGYSNYKIYKNENTIILDNVSLNLFSPTNMFYLYTTTTYPDIVTGDKHGVTKISIFWLWLITSIIFIIFTYILLYIVTKITNYAKGKHWSIIHPILYFSILLEFLFLVSYINFTIMYFYQYNIYEKGALFTEMVVFLLMSVFGIVVYYVNKSKNVFKNSIVSLGVYSIALFLFILFFKEFIYSSSTPFGIPKDMLVFFGEQVFIFSIFILFVNFLSKGEEYIFYKIDKELINHNIYTHIIWGNIVLLLIILILSVTGFIREGQGMVFIESAKLFLFLLVTLLFHHSFSRNKKVYFYSLVSLFLVLVITIGLMKDKGSILQIALAITIIFILFKDNFHIKKRWIFMGIGLTIFIFFLFYQFELKDNVRFAMWTEPFAQEIEPSTQYFMYRYEQVARGLFLIKNSMLVPADFINEHFLPLPAIHTDFIFAFFSNTFGYLGIGALILSLLLLSLSFKKSMELYKNENEIFKFLYGVNSVFVAYMLSYFIINMASVLQIIPLTDVPLPFLTYAKGILVLFFMLYLFVVVFNIKYLEHLNKEKRGLK